MRYHLEGTLTARDCKRHIPHRFAVPDGSGQLDIQLRFAPQRMHGISNLITLTLFDPDGFRGAGHRDGSLHSVHITPFEATPGYQAGALTAGTWTAQIDTHMVMPGEPVQYRLDISLTEDTGGAEAGPRPQLADAPKPSLRGPGWYRGDLHAHTEHSDAAGLTVAMLIQTARDQGLDFLFLTDHNTTAGLAEMDEACSEDFLAAGGVELTTFWGHALCLGTRTWVDWRIRPGTGGMSRIVRSASALGQAFIIAHPQSVGDPFCTGCNWRYGEMMPGTARLVEVWNGPWGGDSHNEAAVSLWYDWLNQGFRLVATAGTDAHSARGYAARPGLSVIHSDALSEHALLQALQQGHLYLSAGPEVSFQAHNECGELWIMGDTVAEPVTLTAAWADCHADAQVRLIADGRLMHQWPAIASGERQWDIAPEDAHWVLVEIRDRTGQMLAVTNPIFLGQDGACP